MLKLDRPLVVLDVETTGPDPEQDRVVQLAWARIEPAEEAYVPEVRAFLIHPGGPIPEEATAIHGISDADVEDAQVFSHWARRFRLDWTGSDVCGFNARSFDLPLLKREFERAAEPWPFDGARVLDIFRVYNRMEPRTLGAACRLYLGREIDGAHDAKADVAHTVQVLQAQAERYGVSTLDELAALERDPSWVDQEGKLKMVNGVVMINFGKWAGTPLSKVETGYLRWIANGAFPRDLQHIVVAELDERQERAMARKEPAR